MFCCSKESSLRSAAWHGDADRVDQLLQTSVNVESRGVNEMTALHRAACGGHYPVVKLLVEKGKADTGARTLQGLTPLHFAAANGHTNVVLEFTMNYGSRPAQGYDAVSDPENCQRIVQYLVEKGVDVNAQSASRHWTVHNDSAGLTPLHLNCLCGHSAQTARALLRAGARSTAVTAAGDTPLHLALAHNAVRPVEMGRALLEHEPDDDQQDLLKMKNKAGLTAVEWARKLGKQRAAVADKLMAVEIPKK